MADSPTPSQSYQQISEAIRINSDLISRMDERIKILHDQYESLKKEIEFTKETSVEMKGRIIAVDVFLSKNLSERIIKLEEEHRSSMHECIEKTSALSETTKEVRGLVRDGQGTMPSILARLIMVENSIRRLMEQAVENRGLIDDNVRVVRSIEIGLTKVGWDQQSIQGKIEIAINLLWKIAIPIIGAFILWKLGFKHRDW